MKQQLVRSENDFTTNRSRGESFGPLFQQLKIGCELGPNFNVLDQYSAISFNNSSTSNGLDQRMALHIVMIRQMSTNLDNSQTTKSRENLENNPLIGIPPESLFSETTTITNATTIHFSVDHAQCLTVHSITFRPSESNLYFLASFCASSEKNPRVAFKKLSTCGR